MIYKKYLPLWIATFFLGGWLVLSAYTNTAQFGDNFEQFNWAHSAEWGYWKHPPVTTWLLIGYQSVFGFHTGNTYVLSFICLSVTHYFTWKIAQALLTDNWAGLVVLLLSLHQMWTWRAQLYNHNVVLIMMVSACTLLTLDLIKNKEEKIWKWGGLGVLAGLSVLTKYQAAIPLLGLLLVVIFYASSQRKKIWPGLALAFFTFGLTLVPHVIWIYETKFLIFNYATHSMSGGTWKDRSINLLSFSVQQLKYVGLMLLAVFIMKSSKAWSRLMSHSKLDAFPENSQIENMPMHIIWGVFLFPIVVFLVLNQTIGVRLQNHWGMQLLLFLPLLLVWRISLKAEELNFRRMVGIYLCIQAVNIGLYVATLHPAKPGDVDYPAQKLADKVTQTWNEQTSCPLLFISGPPFEAGVASVYSGYYPDVVDEGDLLKSPWVSDEMLETHGYVKMTLNAESSLDQGPVHQVSNDLQVNFPRLQALSWVNVLPKNGCN